MAARKTDHGRGLIHQSRHQVGQALQEVCDEMRSVEEERHPLRRLARGKHRGYIKLLSSSRERNAALGFSGNFQ